MIQRAMQQQGITLVNIYAPNTGARKQVKPIMMDINGKIKMNIDVIGDFNTSLSSIHRSARQRINKEMVTINDMLDEMDLIVNFRTFHPKSAEYTFFCF